MNRKPFAFLLLSASLLASCGGGGGNNIHTDSQGNVENRTIMVKLYKGGYGEKWLTDVAKKFEETYASEGYKVQIVEHSNLLTGDKVMQELLLGQSKNDVDLYFTIGIPMAKVISQSKKTTHDENELVLEPLDDVISSKAIGFDGQEENETIESRFVSGYLDRMAYQGSLSQFAGKHYSLPWASGACAMAVNESLLTNYGLSIPRTSDEFVADVQAISAQNASTGVYPYTFAGNNAAGYLSYVFETYFAQLTGKSTFLDFVDVNPKTGTRKDNGYSVYDNEDMHLALKDIERILNLDYAPNGASSQKHIEAQHQLLEKKAVFMPDGDWLMGEMYDSYPEETKSVKMMKIPVSSSLGTKLGITDAVLSKAIEAIDEGKNDAEVAALDATLDADKASSIRAARSLYLNIGANHNAVIPSYADAKIGAKKFLRFLYSQDGCSLFLNDAKAYLPLSYTPRESDLSCDYLTSLHSLTSSSSVTFSDVGDFRSASGLVFFNSPSWRTETTFVAMMEQGETRKYPADTVYSSEKEYVKSNWANWSSAA